MQNEIDKEFLRRVVQRPIGIETRRITKMVILFQNLKALAKDKALIFDENEFKEMYGANAKNNVKNGMRKLGGKGVVAEKNGKVYVWLRGENG